MSDSVGIIGNRQQLKNRYQAAVRGNARRPLFEDLERRVLLTADLAGNTLAAARVVPLTASATAYVDAVGPTDTVDYYTFTTTDSRNFSLALTGLSADVDVELLNSSGGMIAISDRGGTQNESIVKLLSAGTYYVKVLPYNPVGSSYTLTLVGAAVVPDGAGKTLATARDVGALSATPKVFNGAVNNANPNDYYKFTLTAQSNLALTLTQLLADADVQLLSSTGRTIAYSNKGGITFESINVTLDAGTYFVRVYPYGGAATSYSLSLTATAITPPPAPPAPTPPASTPPTPPAPPAPTPSPAGTVSVTSRVLSSITELDITGSSGDDTITLSQSGSVLTILANGVVTTLGLGYGDVVIHGGAGNDTITVDSSVTLNVDLYGDAGNDTLRNMTSGRGTIVAIGGGTDSLQGTATTSLWADTADTTSGANATHTHKLAAFYQPSGMSIPLELLGQNLPDPTDSGAETRLTNRSFWGAAPVMTDINQGALGDCYYVSTLAGLAYSSPATLVNMAVDLGDGTYAVQFYRNGQSVVVRVDGDLSGSGSNTNYNHTGASGDLWACIFEKAFTYFRTGANTYASIASGWMGEVLTDLGQSNTFLSASGSDASLAASISAALNSGHCVTAGTDGTVSGAPVVGSHAYTVLSAVLNGSGQLVITLRNPWGVDGVSNSSNMSDGIVTLTGDQFRANFDGISLAT